MYARLRRRILNMKISKVLKVTAFNAYPRQRVHCFGNQKFKIYLIFSTETVDAWPSVCTSCNFEFFWIPLDCPEQEAAWAPLNFSCSILDDTV